MMPWEVDWLDRHLAWFADEYHLWKWNRGDLRRSSHQRMLTIARDIVRMP